ncbi:MAG TPA: protein-glutamate O-methyltransferase CheR [Tepidisphaeraceae bacterium]|jgi:chemotaxis protein methyltransferase CheR
MIANAESDINEQQFRRLCDLVYQHCGINLHDGKQELVRARVARQLRTKDYASAAEYLDDVMANPGGEEFASLIDALSTNLTSFFRESSHFKYLTDTLLPKAMDRQRRKGGCRIRGWSAACSTGEEPYTLAMTLHNALQGRGQWDARILATDISRNVLKTAVLGRYEASRVSSIPIDFRNKYFTQCEGLSSAQHSVMQVASELRSMVTFNYLNLMDPWPFTGPFDFIFCRNVMIYFDKKTQEKLVSRFWNCLESGGVLFTGHSESLTGISHKFQYVQPTIYMKA